MIIRMTGSAEKTVNLAKNGKLKREFQWYLQLAGSFLKQNTKKASGWKQGCPKP